MPEASQLSADVQHTPSPLEQLQKLYSEAPAEGTEPKRPTEAKSDQWKQYAKDATKTVSKAEEASDESPTDETEEVEEEAASDEDVSAEDSAAEDSEEGAEPEEQGKEPQPKRLKVKIDGEEVEVTLDELRNGYQRQADYTRKSQANAEIRKQLEADQAKQSQKVTEYERNIGLLEAVLSAPIATPEELKKLLEDDPQEYLKAKAKEEARKEHLNTLRKEREKIAEERQEQDRKALTLYAKDQEEMLKQKMPEVLTPENVSSLKTYLSSMGYQNKELAELYDHRAVMIAEKARRYDEMSNKSLQKKKVNTPPKVQKPGTPRPKGQDVSRSRLNESLARLKKTGSKEDALAAFRTLYS